MNEATYNSLMGSLAADAAEAHALVVKGADSRFKNPEFAAKNKKYIDPNRFYKEILEQLKNKYPRESTSESDLGDLAETKGEVVEKWLYDKGPSPTEYKANVEASKFMPILQGVADEGDDWYSMGNERLKRFASGLGWKVNTPEDYQKFLDKVGEYQQAFDRGKISDELRNSPWYTVGQLVAPTATQEIDNAVATGKGGDASDVTKLALLDYLTNVGIFATPSLEGTRIMSKAPTLAKPVIEALAQGAIEAGRQGGKEALSETGQEFDFAPVVTTTELAATIPGIFTSAGALNRFGGGESKNKFVRGLMSAARRDDPIEKEREALAKSIKQFNESDLLKVLNGEAEEIAATGTPAEMREAMRLNGLNETIEELFGVPMESKGFDVERVLKNYDKPIRENWVITKEGIKRKPKDSVILGDGYDVLDLDEVTSTKFASNFPAKYDAETSGAYKAGRAAGERLLDFGGRIEPMTKTGWSITGGVKTPENDYKKSDWYSKMSDNKKKLVDEAFKQKAMEREFEELVKEKPEAVRRAQMDIPDRDLKNPLTEKEYELVMAMRKRGFEKMLGGEQ